MGWFVCEGDAGRDSGPCARGRLPWEQPAGAGPGGCPTAQSRTCQFTSVLIAASSSPQLMPLPFSQPAAPLSVGLGVLPSFVWLCPGRARRRAGGCSGPLRAAVWLGGAGSRLPCTAHSAMNGAGARLGGSCGHERGRGCAWFSLLPPAMEGAGACLG